MFNKMCLFIFMLSLSSCAGAYKSTYVVGATVQTFITEAHKEYDERVHTQLEKCDPQHNEESTVKTKEDFDRCMTPAFGVSTQKSVLKALAAYNAVATSFSLVMLGCEPVLEVKTLNAATCVKKTFTSSELRSWRGKLVTAALEALRAFPNSEQRTNELMSLVGKY